MHKISNTDQRWMERKMTSFTYVEQQIAVFFVFFKWRRCLISYIQEILWKRFVQGKELLLLSETSISSPFTLNLSTKEALEDMLKVFLVPQSQQSLLVGAV